MTKQAKKAYGYRLGRLTVNSIRGFNALEARLAEERSSPLGSLAVRIGFWTIRIAVLAAIGLVALFSVSMAIFIVMVVLMIMFCAALKTWPIYCNPAAMIEGYEAYKREKKESEEAENAASPSDAPTTQRS